MKQKSTFFSLITAAALVSGCASFVSRSSYPINITSRPAEATISITDHKGIEVYKGNTPTALALLLLLTRNLLPQIVVQYKPGSKESRANLFFSSGINRQIPNVTRFF